MKKLAAILVFVSLAGPAVADKKPTPKPTESAARTKDSATMSSIRNMRITQINEKDKVFAAVAADGKEYRFTFQKIEGWKVGSVVDVTYTGTLGGPKPAMASNLNLSKSN
jgi:outer membrane lipoprotein SlyB